MKTNLTRRQFAVTAGAAVGAAAVGFPFDARAAITLKYGNAGNAKSRSNTFARQLFDEVEKRTGGEVKVDIFAGTLGGEKTLIDGLALGTIDIYNGAYTGTREFDILYAPYFFRDSMHAGNVVKNLLADKLSKVLTDRYQSHFIAVGRAGPWSLFTNEKLDSFADIKGMKIRAPQIEGPIKGLEHLGAKPTVVPFNELYSALQQGVVDGMVTLGSLGITQKFYEVVKHIYKNDFGIGLDKLVISNKAWGRLSAEQQKILVGTFHDMEPKDYYQATIDQQPGDWAKWEELNGKGTAIMLDATAAQTAMEPLNEQLANEVFGPGTWGKIKAM